MKDEKLIGFGVFFSTAFLLIIASVVLDYNGLYGQDSHEYFRYSNRIFDYFVNGIPPGDYFWPVNYPLLGALLSFVTGPGIALQLISIAGASWILYLMAMFLLSEFPGREKVIVIYTILFLGMSPYFFRYTVSIMSDIPAMAFACTAYYAIYRFHKSHNQVLLYAVWFFAAMAVFTRFALFPMLLPAVLFAGYLMVKNFNAIGIILAVLFALVPIFIFVYFKQQNSGEIFHHYLVTDWSIKNYFRSSFVTLDGISDYSIPNLVFVFSFLVHPGFIFPGVLFLLVLFTKKNKPSFLSPLVLSGMLLYLFFVAGIPSRNMRYLLPVLPFYLAICFPSFLTILAWHYNRRWILLFVSIAAFLIQGGLVRKAFYHFYQLNRDEKSLALKVLKYDPKVLYTFGVDGAIRNYGYNGTIINLWNAPLLSAEKGALVLFNKQNAELQWKGQNPLLNFYFLVDSAKAELKESLLSGWEFYEVKETYPIVGAGFSGVR